MNCTSSIKKNSLQNNIDFFVYKVEYTQITFMQLILHFRSVARIKT